MCHNESYRVVLRSTDKNSGDVNDGQYIVNAIFNPIEPTQQYKLQVNNAVIFHTATRIDAQAVEVVLENGSAFRNGYDTKNKGSPNTVCFVNNAHDQNGAIVLTQTQPAMMVTKPTSTIWRVKIQDAEDGTTVGNLADWILDLTYTPVY